MNKNYLTLTALAVVGGLAASAAQADVVLSGRLRASLENDSFSAPSGVSDSQKGVYSRNTLNNESSYVRISGTEDLGGGISAFFQIETGFDPSGSNSHSTLSSSLSNDINGSQSSRIGSRNTALGFTGVAGTLFFGKWDLYYDTVYLVEPGNLSLPNKTSFLTLNSRTYVYNQANPVANGPRIVGGGIAAGDRYNNVISYTTPSAGGVTLQLATSLGNESVLSPGSSNAYMGTLKYQNNAFTVFGSVLKTKQSQSTISLASVAPIADAIFGRVGAAYKFVFSDDSGWFQIGASIDGYRIKNVTLTTTAGAFNSTVDKESRTSFAIPLGLNFGPTTIVATYGAAGKVKVNNSDISDSRAPFAMLGINYDISKRTAVGAYVAEVFNGKNSNSDFYTANTQVTSAPGGGYGYKPRSIGVSFRHLF